VQFRLVYKGRLASNGDPREKHLVRKFFHPQLAEFWKHHPVLSKQVRQNYERARTPHNLVSDPGPAVEIAIETRHPGRGKPWVEFLGDFYTRGNYRFVPLVRKGHAVCSLDILFLRRDSPGHLIKHSGGDIDNRMKTLFDGLRMAEVGELKQFPTPDANESPFYCLLEDDADISEVRITSDRLLIPLESLEHKDDVHLIIHVQTRIVDPDALFANAHIL
jgi:hypothetical protein